ncbi:hypothetical protein ACJW30_02G215300 [Castanea mollissima]
MGYRCFGDMKETGMDSQMRGDCSFTQLLKEGSIMKTEFMMDSPQDEVHTQQSLHEVQMESITRKTQWGGNFGLGEDCLIVSAWLNTSLDAVQGNEQKHKTYWNRVWEYFNKEKTFTSTRNANSPMNRWSTIQLQTNKFVGILASIEMANPSGVNEQNKIIKAKEVYIKVQVVPFKFDHCWNILRHQPKWLELVAMPQKPQTIRRSTATSSPSTLESIHLGEDEVSHASFVDLERPPGRKTEKEQLNKR